MHTRRHIQAGVSKNAHGFPTSARGAKGAEALDTVRHRRVVLGWSYAAFQSGASGDQSECCIVVCVQH